MRKQAPCDAPTSPAVRDAFSPSNLAHRFLTLSALAFRRRVPSFDVTQPTLVAQSVSLHLYECIRIVCTNRLDAVKFTSHDCSEQSWMGMHLMRRPQPRPSKRGAAQQRFVRCSFESLLFGRRKVGCRRHGSTQFRSRGLEMQEGGSCLPSSWSGNPTHWRWTWNHDVTRQF